VCLGHQAIGEAFGGTLENLSTVYHGVATPIRIMGGRLFEGLRGQIEVGRYHSWIVDKDSLPAELEITAEDDLGYIMAMQHKNFDVQGVQFHPESILTPDGMTIMKNWLKA
jgi:anthranilate synthase component II